MEVWFGHPRGFIVDGAPLLKRGMLKLVDAKLGASPNFSVAHSSLSDDMERINFEGVMAFQVVMNDWRRPLLK